MKLNLQVFLKLDKDLKSLLRPQLSCLKHQNQKIKVIMIMSNLRLLIISNRKNKGYLIFL